MLKLEEIFVAFNAGTSFERIALRGLSMHMQRGDIISLVGRNGSGRTTLLKLLAGHVTSNFGCITFEKNNITNTSINARHKIFSSILYEHTHRMAENMTLIENVASLYVNFKSPKYLFNPITKSFRAEIREKLAELNFHKIEDMLDTYIEDLPGPHRQVLSLFMSAERSAPILLLDDHLVGLDNEMSEQIIDITEQIITKKKLSAIITADAPEFAMPITNRMICMKHGMIEYDISGDELYQKVPHLKRVEKDPAANEAGNAAQISSGTTPATAPPPNAQ